MLSAISGGGARRATATAWLTAPDISGTGTSRVSASRMDFYLADLPDLSTLALEVRYTVQRTAGTGDARGYVFLEQASFREPATVDGFASHVSESLALGRSQGAAAPQRVLVHPVYVQPGGLSVTGSRIEVRVRGSGQNADTEWAITDIRARIIYTPLF